MKYNSFYSVLRVHDFFSKLHSFHIVAKEKYQNLDLQREGVEKSTV